MNEIDKPSKKRKILSIKTEKNPQFPQWIEDYPSKWVDRDKGFIMVYREGGDMPTRVYRPEELSLAIKHAKSLAYKRGDVFHVLRSWRAFHTEV
jgi:hypothetical protein